MKQLFLMVLLLAPSAVAQLQIYTVSSAGAEEPVAGEFDVGEVPTGDFLDTRFRIRNIGEATITLVRLRATGVGFSLEGHPTMPHTVAPASNVDFRLRFRPAGQGFYSGTLRVNDTYIMVFGSSPATVSVLILDGDSYRAVESGETLIFGRLDYGATSSRRFRLQNPAKKQLLVEQLRVTASPFDLPAGPPLPLALRPGESFDFEVLFSPETAGIHRASLLMNDRSFSLEGVSLNAPFARPELLFEPQAPISGQQGKITVRLPAPAPVNGSGVVRMGFIPLVEGVVDDPAVMFLSNGGRSVPLTVEEGYQTARLDGQEAAGFQTGSTAGTIHITVELGDHIETVSLPLPTAPVSLDSGEWEVISPGIQLNIAGFDNTRSTTEVAFTFFDTNGRALTTEPLRVKVGNAFREYFLHSDLGGLFSLRAAFPVAGDVNRIGAAEVQFVNSTGPSRVQRINIR